MQQAALAYGRRGVAWAATAPTDHPQGAYCPAGRTQEDKLEQKVVWTIEFKPTDLTAGADIKVGADAHEMVAGLGSNDYIEGRSNAARQPVVAGNNVLDGGADFNTLVYSAPVAEVTLARTA